MAEKIRFTNASIKSLPIPTKGQQFYYDEVLPGLAVRVTQSGRKVFVVDLWANGRSWRRAIEGGDCAQISVDVARIRARKLIGHLSEGKDPIEKRREAKAAGVNLEQVFNEYLKVRRNLSTRTIYDYRRLIETYLGKWKHRPMSWITKDRVEQLHAELGQASEAQANYTMRLLRALFNFARENYERRDGSSLVPENPVRRLSQLRSWFRVDRRRTKIEVHQLEPWFRAVHDLGSEAPNADVDTVRDYLVLLLLTGLRRGEATRLRWKDVDLQGRSFTIREPKNKEQHTLPMSDYLCEMFARRRQRSDEEFVFPGQGGRGHLVEPRKLLNKVRVASALTFTLYDLRRTFISIAESLDIPAYALKRLLNQKLPSDVTAGYIAIDVERLRDPMQRITDYILSAGNVRPKAQLVGLPQRSLAGAHGGSS